jgi:hypothetical protein
MCHTLANLEHHHFKYPAHRRPGDAHVYFFGADAFSFGDNVKVKKGDVMEIELEGFGRALRNPVMVLRKNPDMSRQQKFERLRLSGQRPMLSEWSGNRDATSAAALSQRLSYDETATPDQWPRPPDPTRDQPTFPRRQGSFERQN